MTLNQRFACSQRRKLRLTGLCVFCTPTYEQLPRGAKKSHIFRLSASVSYIPLLWVIPAHQSDIMGTILMSRLGNPSPFSLSTLRCLMSFAWCLAVTGAGMRLVFSADPGVRSAAGVRATRDFQFGRSGGLSGLC